MTRILAVDDKGDIYLGKDGRLVIALDLEAVLQACEHAVKAQLGEMVLAVDKGVPNFDTLWRGSPNLGQFEAAIRLALLAVAGVVRVTEFKAVRVGPVVQYTATIETIYGAGAVNG
jgi:hypothetical protein